MGGSAGGPDVPPAPASLDWCERVVPGPPGKRSFAVDLSAAHASVRFFGHDISHVTVDHALVDAFASSAEPWSLATLEAYAEALPTVCHLAAGAETLPAAKVELSGTVAVVRPGTGELALPAGATAVAIDLRGLPAVEGLRDALEQAAALALAEPVAQPKVQVREHRGLTDEYLWEFFGANGIYSNKLTTKSQPALPAGAPVELPIVLLTEARLAPDAARFALALRRAGRAWLAGEDLLTAVAEASWFGVGQGGLLHRDRELVNSKLLPDQVAADVRTLVPEQHVERLLALGSPPKPSATPAERPSFAPLLSPELDKPTVATPEPPLARAALIVAHGAARLFFPYFPVIGDTIDEGLEQEQGALDGLPASARPLWGALSRFSSHLRDSHCWTLPIAPGSGKPPAAGFLPLLLDSSAQGEALVRRSALEGIQAGDVIETIDGQPMAERVAGWEPLISASNDGGLRRDALLFALQVAGPSQVVARAADGKKKSVSVPLAALSTPRPTVSDRKAGFLGDLGAADLFYINFDGPVFKSPVTASEVMAEASSAAGLILDARGYPGTVETWEVIQRVIKTSSMIRLSVPEISPLERTSNVQDQPWTPVTSGPRFDGPVAVLIGPWTQSAAEHMLIPLVNEKRATFVGRRTSGANGNITSVRGPGPIALSFTGMEVRYDNGATFHGLGIAPDVTVTPSAPSLAASPDPELAAAIELLKP